MKPKNTKSEATNATRNKPDLSKVDTCALLNEIHRRKDAIVWSIMADDLTSYWECDDSGATHPGSRVPSGAAMMQARKAFENWQDEGANEAVMELMRSAWFGADQEGGAL